MYFKRVDFDASPIPTQVGHIHSRNCYEPSTTDLAYVLKCPFFIFLFQIVTL